MIHYTNYTLKRRFPFKSIPVRRQVIQFCLQKAQRNQGVYVGDILPDPCQLRVTLPLLSLIRKASCRSLSAVCLCSRHNTRPSKSHVVNTAYQPRAEQRARGETDELSQGSTPVKPNDTVSFQPGSDHSRSIRSISCPGCSDQCSADPIRSHARRTASTQTTRTLKQSI